MQLVIKNRLQQWLDESGDNYAKAAEKVGVHYTTISRIAKNQIDRIDLDTLEKLCDVYQKPIESFLYRV